MAILRSYRDLAVWAASIELVERCHALIVALPRSQRFVLGDQLLRAAVSIPANIAEGHRRPRRSYLNHLSIALGSEAELETHIEIVHRLKLCTDAERAETIALAESVARMLHALVKSLRQLG
ncbi:MAG: four helix bundle protein [Acidobacteria bacterium]|nr:four helix bundle protein [Acidobacteriota bacterium]